MSSAKELTSRQILQTGVGDLRELEVELGTVSPFRCTRPVSVTLVPLRPRTDRLVSHFNVPARCR